LDVISGAGQSAERLITGSAFRHPAGIKPRLQADSRLQPHIMTTLRLENITVLILRLKAGRCRGSSASRFYPHSFL